jgi:hypothetical protein
MHMVTTPNLQSLPWRFISFRRVATQRAPEQKKIHKFRQLAQTIWQQQPLKVVVV